MAVQAKCPNCGNALPAYSTLYTGASSGWYVACEARRVYCSARCRVAAWRARRRAEEALS